MMKTLQEVYKEQIVPDLQKRFNYTNVMRVPRLIKIVVNCGVGDSTENNKAVDHAVADIKVITGQQPIVIKSKKAISNFKLKENQPIGVKVTLRKQYMYDFLSRLINLSLPRIRDFRGVPAKFDGRGNYNLGLKEQTIFPEVNLEQVDKVRGMDIAIVTTAKTDDEVYWLLKGFGMPFREKR